MGKSAFIILFLAALNITTTEAQLDSFELQPRYGGLLHYNLNLHSSSFSKLPGVPSCCPEFTSGFGSGFSFGGLFDYPLDYDLMLNFRLIYGTYGGSFEELEPEIVLIDGFETQGKFKHELDASIGAITGEFMAGYRLWRDLFAHAGFKTGFMLNADYDQIETVAEPSDRGTFGNGRSYRNDTSGSIDEASAFQFGINAGVSYELPLNKDRYLLLVPELYYSFMFTPVVSGYDWFIHTIRAGVAVKYRTPPPPPPPPPPPANPPFPGFRPPKEPPTLTIAIEAMEIDSNGTGDHNFSIRIEDFVSLNMRPLLNYVFFDSNSAAMPPRYKRLNPDDTYAFDQSELKEKRAMETYYHVLNIYGRRLRDNPDTKVTLYGCNAHTGAEKGNLELSRNRAETVRDYLRDVWGIEEERLNVRWRNLPDNYSNTEEEEGREENRRVEILTNDFELSEPVITIDTMRVLSASKIRFMTEVESEVGIRDWKVVAMQDRKELIAWEGEGIPPEDLYWEVNNESASAPLKGGLVYYYMTVTDNLGQIATTQKHRMPIEQLTVDRKRLERRQDKEFEYYRLILFDYGRSSLGSEHRKVVDIVRDRVTEDAKVFIYGHTDSMGEEEINQKISQRRADAVARRLNIRDAIVEGVGESDLLYDNSLPEGRFYCRTVMITIETPVVDN